MSEFDPAEQVIRLLDTITGFQSRTANKDPYEMRRNGVDSNGNTGHLIYGIRCWLVGWRNQGQRLLETAEIAYAFAWEDRNPTRGPERQTYTPVMTINDLYLAKWLSRGINDPDIARLAIDQRIARSNARPKDIRGSLQFYAEELLDVGAYETFLDISRTGGFQYSRARSLTHYYRPHVMVWIMGSTEFSEDEKHHWLIKFLNRNIPEFLAGHYSRAARWAKIAYWKNGESGLSPFEVICKIYDHLPNVEMPPESECPIVP